MAGRTVTRAQLIEAINQEVGVPKRDSEKMIVSILNRIGDVLSKGESVKMKYDLIVGTVLATIVLYCFLNYKTILQKQFEAFNLGDSEEDHRKKKIVELRQRSLVVAVLLGAIWLLLQGLSS